MGLTQIMPVIAREYRLDDPFDPESNLEAGLRHLRRLLGRYEVRRALAAYNAGEGAVARYGGVPPYRETQQYVRRVLTLLR
jgi:soluble lytic murein transglycosylase-like protein